MSTFNLCLLIIKGPVGLFRLISIQINNTLILNTPAFLAKEKKKIQKAKIVYKPKTTLIPTSPINYNSTRLLLYKNKSLNVN
jgi:hypothetical protein